MKNELGDRQRLEHIFEASNKILIVTKEFDEQEFRSNFLVNAAVCHFITVIGEAAANFTVDFKQLHAEFDWKAIKGMRNIIVHEYFGIDYTRVWFAVQNHVPKLKSDCEIALKDFE